MTNSGEIDSPTTATCRLTFDGYVVLAESSMTIADGLKTSKGTWNWNLPFGLGGNPHYIGVTVVFR